MPLASQLIVFASPSFLGSSPCIGRNLKSAEREVSADLCVLLTGPWAKVFRALLPLSRRSQAVLEQMKAERKARKKEEARKKKHAAKSTALEELSVPSPAPEVSPAQSPVVPAFQDPVAVLHAAMDSDRTPTVENKSAQIWADRVASCSAEEETTVEEVDLPQARYSWHVTSIIPM